MFENKVTVVFLRVERVHFSQYLKTLFALWNITEGLFWSSILPFWLKSVLLEDDRLHLDSTAKVSSFIEPTENGSFPHSSTQRCTIGLCWQIYLVHHNPYDELWWTFGFALFSLFNIMLKVSGDADLLDTLFLFMCCMWKNHLQRGWGVKASTGLNHRRFVLLPPFI